LFTAGGPGGAAAFFGGGPAGSGGGPFPERAAFAAGAFGNSVLVTEQLPFLVTELLFLVTAVLIAAVLVLIQGPTWPWPHRFLNQKELDR